MEPSTTHQVVCFGEVLWDILPSGPLAGGAPMNVAYHLNKLGANPALVTKIGLDAYGEKLVNQLASTGLSTEYFYVDEEHPTGLVYANANDFNEVIYDIVYPSSWDFIDWQPELTELVSNAAYFVFGSLTSRNAVSKNTLNRLLQVAKNKVLDINLRSPHYHRTHVEFLLHQADILKMNLAELELITGWFSTFSSIEERMRIVQETFSINTLIVTMGGDGAIVNHLGKTYHHAGFKVQVADTIGSGDAFLAGFLSKLLQDAPIDDALAFASAIGAYIATRSGACPDYQLKNITDLTNNTLSSKLEKQF